MMKNASERRSSPGWALAGLSLCMLLPALGISSANLALPTLAHAFGASFPAVQWVVLAYLLAITTLIVGAGRAGDVVGRRRLLVGGIVLFSAASALCALAPTLGLLIAARAAQGLGAAILMALAMAFVGDAVPKARTGSAMGLLGTMSALGTALGPSLGGLLIAGAGWPAIFVLNLPFGLAAVLLVRRHLPADRPQQRAGSGGFDLPGTVLLALTLAAYALAMTLGRGHFGPLNIALLAAAAVGGVLFARVEARAASPLIRWARLREPALRASLGSSALVSTVVMATLVVGPFHLTRGLGLDTALVGIALAIGPLVAALTGVPAGRLVDQLGARRVTQGGLAAMAAGCATLCVMPMAAGIAGYVAPLVVVTAGYALFQAANNTAVMADVPADQRGVMSALLSLSRNLGLISGAAAMGAVFAAAVGTVELAAARPEAVVYGMRVTFALATLLLAAALALTRGSPTIAATMPRLGPSR